MSRDKHDAHQSMWEAEHACPKLFPQLNSTEPAGGVKRFCNWLKKEINEAELVNYRGLEMGCGKGRNTIWLGKQGFSMEGFDFSTSAIVAASDRVKVELLNNVSFRVMDARDMWSYPSNRFDFVVDCFASVDIDKDVAFVFSEVYRVLRPGGYFFIYTNSPETEAYKEFSISGGDYMYRYPDTKKLERVFSEEQLEGLLPNFKELVSEKFNRYNKYNDKDYLWNHLWLIYQKIIKTP